MIQCVLLINRKSRLANDDSYLTFIVQSLCKIRMWVDVVSRGHDTGRSLGEDDGMGRLVDFIASVVTTFVELLSMCSIVFANTKDVPTVDWR